MTNDAGSYAFGAFHENERELDRLKRQAKVALKLEQAIWARAGLKPGTHVLDLACGPGVISCELARAVGPEGTVLGIDYSADLLLEAERLRVSEGLTNIAFQQGNVYQLQLAPRSFGFVYARLLMQHLADPAAALAGLRGVVECGGIVCLVDIDDSWLCLAPELEAFTSFTRAAAEGQRQRGGDRHVGRKLGPLLHSAGFHDVHTEVQVITSHDIGLRTFLDITTGFKREQIPPERREAAEAELEAIYGLLERPEAWGAVGVFVATARA
jgi:SAM-dependent methyltransferase